MVCGSCPASEMAPRPTFLVGQRSVIWFAVSGKGCSAGLGTLLSASSVLQFCFLFIHLSNTQGQSLCQGGFSRALFLDGSRAVYLTVPRLETKESVNTFDDYFRVCMEVSRRSLS